MNESLTDYVSALSGSDMATLDEIVTKKYRKFIRFFHLVRDYTKYIKKLKYEFSSSDVLSVSITFSKEVSLSDKKELIGDMKKSGYSVESSISGKKMKLSITYAE